MKRLDLDDVRALIAESGLREVIDAACRETTEASAARKALILRHDDLAARLTKQPLNYSHPDKWNGSMPPEMFNQVRNDSPIRVALLALVAEAEKRERHLRSA